MYFALSNSQRITEQKTVNNTDPMKIQRIVQSLLALTSIFLASCGFSVEDRRAPERVSYYEPPSPQEGGGGYQRRPSQEIAYGDERRPEFVMARHHNSGPVQDPVQRGQSRAHVPPPADPPREEFEGVWRQKREKGTGHPIGEPFFVRAGDPALNDSRARRRPKADAVVFDGDTKELKENGLPDHLTSKDGDEIGDILRGRGSRRQNAFSAREGVSESTGPTRSTRVKVVEESSTTTSQPRVIRTERSNKYGAGAEYGTHAGPPFPEDEGGSLSSTDSDPPFPE